MVQMRLKIAPMQFILIPIRQHHLTMCVLLLTLFAIHLIIDANSNSM